MIAAAEEQEHQTGMTSYLNSFSEKSKKFYNKKKESENSYKQCGSKGFMKSTSSDKDIDNNFENCIHSKFNQGGRKKDYDQKNKEISIKHQKSFARPRSNSDDSSDDRKKGRYELNSNQSKDKSSSKNKYVKPSSSSSSSESEERIRKKSARKSRNREKSSSKRCKDKTFSKHPSSSRSSSSQSRSSSGTSIDSEQERRQSRKKSQEDRKKSDYYSHIKKSTHSRKTEYKRSFAKPSLESDDEDRKKPSLSKSYSSSSQGWRKKTVPKEHELKLECHGKSSASSELNKDETDVGKGILPAVEEPVLTDKEMNDLAAKLVKAELLGNKEKVEELKAKLERARELKANKPKEPEIKEEVVVLTHTDSRGFTRPVSLGGPLEPSGGRRKAKKVETHTGGKRTRYFADDDKYNLQEMFQREKLSTVEDSNSVFAKLASKGVGRDDSARDMDDVFEETARTEESEGKRQARDRQQAINESKRVARSLDNCQWCLESREMLKHLIVAIGHKCYVCVPPYQSLTENHCLIVPSHHTPCATQLDEDVWSEIMDFRKSVVQMFLAQDEDVVFFESARNLGRLPHMVLNCVPMPKETGDLAPIYFKKAIQECEMEWSNNKKLVDLKGKDVRRAVPKGLPYFAVDFGMESGFAHVIEDEQHFPPNFAQEIIGGMLDLDHTIWRKQRRQTFEEQSKKVLQLTKLWTPYDFTKKK